MLHSQRGRTLLILKIGLHLVISFQNVQHRERVQSNHPPVEQPESRGHGQTTPASPTVRVPADTGND